MISDVARLYRILDCQPFYVSHNNQIDGMHGTIYTVVFRLFFILDSLCATPKKHLILNDGNV
ncbi:hypothetical protein DERP_003636 [Dermatophagoides pteronyssinus]|uniref:Uncharacterized protein n=1 Tax=Dermatophagoides pteronyssinus TaxID=6956 RepID=A0ABQ8JLR1_DERPT|nr:hypothetical protein DERP_003636 [Dermatophagoides pteronyssinus]